MILTENDIQNILSDFPKNIAKLSYKEHYKKVFNYNFLIAIPEGKTCFLWFKNFNEKGWGLFNLQTLNVLMAGSTGQVKTETVQNKTDAFSNMLADVVNDPTIKQVSVVKAEPKVVIPVTEEIPAAINKEPQQSEDMAVISKLSENISDTGTQIIYLDKKGMTIDTIAIYLPKEVPQIVTEVVKAGVDTVSVTQPERTVPQTKFLDIEIKNSNDSSANVKKEETKDSVVSIVPEAVNKKENIADVIVISNLKCQNVANKSDFEKLRRKMNSAHNMDDMIAVSKKYFKAKCYTTKQIRGLSDLFLSDEDKYKFFDAAYPYVSDNDKFSSLESLLTDQYYIKRFKAMIMQ